jgi:prepilin-type N-terminal cleavage/methylation domain-containing protein
MRGSTRGFTILELLVALTLLGSLGVLLAQLIRNSFRLYHQGEVRGEIYLEAVPLLEDLERDVLSVHGGPEGRFIVEAEGGGLGRGEGFLLRMVCGLPGGERGHAILRRASTEVSPTEVWRGEDVAPADRGRIAPPSGICEVAWALVADPADQGDREGLLTLYRGVRAPALDPGGFFDPADDSQRDEAWVRRHLQPVASNVLGCWVLCFGQGTESWDEEAALAGRATAGGSLREWDSTRGQLPATRFALARGPASRDDPRDDVFPSRVRIVLHQARGATPDARLRRGATADDGVLRLSGALDLFDLEDGKGLPVKVGREWVEVIGLAGTDLRVRRLARGGGSLIAAHPAGTPVFLGKSFRKTVAIPARRSHFGAAGVGVPP